MREHRLPVGLPGPNLPFHRVLEERRTIRAIRSASWEQVTTLLWHALRTRAAFRGWEHRASPSAGGLHPVDLLLVGLTQAPAIYDANRHTLGELEVPDPAQFASAIKVVETIVPTANGTFVFLIADSDRVEARYEHPESLLWRDAGCVVATVQFVATWLGLVALPLGILGEDVIGALALRHNLVPVGALIVGEPFE